MIELLKQAEALLEGHFLLSSGKHSNRYVQCAKLLQYPDMAAKAVEEVVKKLEGVEFDVVVGPAMGGIIVAYELGRQLKKPAFFTEREDGQMKLKRGFEIKPGQKILIAEDVVTTGKSSFETVRVLEEYGGKVVGIACLVDRSKEKLSLPIYEGTKLDIETYEMENCPLCKEGLPIVKPGSRKIVQR